MPHCQCEFKAGGAATNHDDRQDLPARALDQCLHLAEEGCYRPNEATVLSRADDRIGVGHRTCIEAEQVIRPRDAVGAGHGARVRVNRGEQSGYELDASSLGDLCDRNRRFFGAIVSGDDAGDHA